MIFESAKLALLSAYYNIVQRFLVLSFTHISPFISRLLTFTIVRRLHTYVNRALSAVQMEPTSKTQHFVVMNLYNHRRYKRDKTSHNKKMLSIQHWMLSIMLLENLIFYGQHSHTTIKFHVWWEKFTHTHTFFLLLIVVVIATVVVVIAIVLM